MNDSASWRTKVRAGASTRHSLLEHKRRVREAAYAGLDPPFGEAGPPSQHVPHREHDAEIAVLSLYRMVVPLEPRQPEGPATGVGLVEPPLRHRGITG